MMPPLALAGFAADGAAFKGVGVVVASDEEEGDEEGFAALEFAGFAVAAGVGDDFGDGEGVAAVESSVAGAVNDCAWAVEIASSRRTESSNPLIMMDDSCVSEEVVPLAR
jgi:hypothetical protein